MFLHIKTLRFIFLSLLAIVLLSGCEQADEKFKSYSVGFSTPNVKVWVSTATLDHRIQLSAGSLQGTWEEASKTNAVFNEPMPREIYVRWEEDKTGVRYEATVKLVVDLAKRAKKLPPVRLNVAQSIFRDIYIIIGMSTGGRVTVWLTNAPYASGNTGRVIQVIGEAQATLVKDAPLKSPRDK